MDILDNKDREVVLEKSGDRVKELEIQIYVDANRQGVILVT